MKLFDVYPLWNIHLTEAKGCRVYDDKDTEYLDLYGGHAVISVGHNHPHYLKRITEQIHKIGFYSNAVKNELQEKAAEILGRISGYPDYQLFLCNSGAEANENAIKLASFHTGKKKILSFRKSFHGRTSGAVAATDNPKIIAPFNQTQHVVFAPLNDIEAAETALSANDYAAVIIEGIQGIAGIILPTDEFLKELRALCSKYNALLIVDEIQSGYGRTGKFFAHQWAGIRPDIITVAKGMGNGFPVGGVLITPDIKPIYGMLGSTFGGNHLACAAALAVMEIMEEEKLVENARETGEYTLNVLRQIAGIQEIRGRGLMIGIEMPYAIETLRNKLLFEHHIFTGNAGSAIIRLLPPLCVSREEINIFIEAFKSLI